MTIKLWDLDTRKQNPWWRFWSKVLIGDGCWLWTGAKNNQGYGVVNTGKRGKTELAHRVAYRLAVAPLTPGKKILHRCDIPLCVRPDHLWEGTQSENMLDCYAKGRR